MPANLDAVGVAQADFKRPHPDTASMVSNCQNSITQTACSRVPYAASMCSLRVGVTKKKQMAPFSGIVWPLSSDIAL